MFAVVANVECHGGKVGLIMMVSDIFQSISPFDQKLYYLD